MCRHVAHLGPATTLEQLLVNPAHGLLRQSWAPRRQAHGVVNADGFGVGFWGPERAAPARYRRAVPMWADASFASLAGVVRSTCVVAAVRSASAGTPPDESACAPFLLGAADGPGVLLSHNGRVRVEALAPLVDSAALAALGSTVDSAYVAALVQARLGSGLRDALADVVREVGHHDPSARLNLLAADGTTVVATTWGDTLSTRVDERGASIASEPDDDGPGWHDVPDHSLVTVTADGTLTVEDL